MQIVAQLIEIIMCVLMFRVNRPHKVALLVLSAICFADVTVPFIPFGNTRYILSICFLLSELKFMKDHFQEIKKSVLYSIMLSVGIALITLSITSPHYDDLYQYTRLFLQECVTKYFVICYAFLSIRSEKDLEASFKVSYYGVLVLTGFAILNYVTKNAMFVDAMYQAGPMSKAGSMFTYSYRFRVQAMFFNPFDYGYICALMFLFNWYGYMISLVSKKRFYIIAGCCAFGIIACGCRTLLFSFLIGTLVYLFFASGFGKTVRKVVLCAILSTVVVSCSPFLQEKMDFALSVFDKNSSSVKGSSIQMRIGQYTAVLYHIRNHALFGRGKDFFNIDLGYGEGMEYLVDKNLYGMEGVLLVHLLERGLVGTIFYLFFYTKLFLFLVKNREVNKRITALALASISVYFSFANMTGELAAVFPTLLIVGACVRLITNIKRENGRVTNSAANQSL